MDSWEEEVAFSPAGGHAAFKVKICELPMADGVHASTGCQLWSSSIVLARELMGRPQIVEKRRVLEVGAGCGLLGLAVSRLARQTLITDGDEEVVRNLARNIDLNRSLWSDDSSLGDVTSRVLRWEELLDDPWPCEDHVEVIVASDIIYGNWGDTVGEALCRVLEPDGVIILAASEDRRGGMRCFQDHMKTKGFGVLESKLRVPILGSFRIYECRRSLFGKCPELVQEKVAEPGPLQCPSEAPQARPATKPKERPPRLWRVVGGRMQGGIIVRHGAEGVTKEDYIGRLKHGALVQELERKAHRLLYTKLQGDGPDRGWISFQSAKGAVLIRREDAGDRKSVV